MTELWDWVPGRSGAAAGAEARPAVQDGLDTVLLLALNESLLDELAHPGSDGPWVEAWRRIGERAGDRSPEARLAAVAAASELLSLVTALADRASLGLLQLSDLVRTAWPYLATLGEAWPGPADLGDRAPTRFAPL